MTAKDNVLLSSDPVFRDVMLGLLEGCRDLREACARMSETVLNALMSAEADEACGARWGERSEGRVNSRNGYRERRALDDGRRAHPRDPEAEEGVLLPRRAT